MCVVCGCSLLLIVLRSMRRVVYCISVSAHLIVHLFFMVYMCVVFSRFDDRSVLVLCV